MNFHKNFLNLKRILQPFLGQVKREYREFCLIAHARNYFNFYSRQKRLDLFWMEIHGNSKDWNVLSKSLRICTKKDMILSTHRTSDV